MRTCYTCKEEKPLTSEHWYKRRGLFKRACKPCEKLYMVQWKLKNATYKSDYYQKNKELELARIRLWQANNTGRMRDNSKNRNNRKRAGGSGDKIVLSILMERDKDRCWLCGRFVNKEIAHPHPLSPSIDHVILLSQDGPHTWENVKLSHLRCNMKRPKKPANQKGPS